MDPIGPKGSTPDLRVAPVTNVAAPAPVALVATASHETPRAPTPGQLASALAAQPPVDADRVARIKKAIAEGTFPILPATIADRMLALKYDWMSNDPA
ncbi:flagellar biosynthesis anti-sigma factor FlgM [Sphingomonas sp.]|uniref:flagellar biosynthesis anti-sigma factor FlgM n=1 Tax=Sphingomonas sp. TaxID=28214 RepID=UPI002E3599DE|nr:flagellar biosynthesis anti-sigma factor FlgM [Sphingomonas sp.]HEX4694583.1 flagellar biosynthesis anti-sigma factor FlgM [Sphingomonas sp.]